MMKTTMFLIGCAGLICAASCDGEPQIRSAELLADLGAGQDGEPGTSAADAAPDAARDAEATKIDSKPADPVCPCFVKAAWCGAGVGEEAADRGCTVPLLPAHDDDLLFCPDGEWSVLEECSEGCVGMPAGTPDVCKTAGSST